MTKFFLREEQSGFACATAPTHISRILKKKAQWLIRVCDHIVMTVTLLLTLKQSKVNLSVQQQTTAKNNKF